MIPEKFQSIKLSHFDYLLPAGRIAQLPLVQRDESKLLVYDKGTISNHIFKEITELLPVDSQLILNNAKVIPARLNFYKSTGAKIEIFLLEPISPSSNMELALRVKDKCTWQCMIGNLKRWKDDEILKVKLDFNGQNLELSAQLISREKQSVQFSWEGESPFSSIIDLAGKTPLPPYIKRDVNPADLTAYQTVFAKQEGAVAAPTAGLHFSEEVLNQIRKKNITTSEVTLYVGAGTFAPVNVETMVEHEMHAEMISVQIETVHQLLKQKTRVAVGTTSLRTLETLYWIGIKIHQKENEPTSIDKLYPYTFLRPPLSWEDSLECVINYMESLNLQTLSAKTAIMIMPGYKFISSRGLITNFHHPKTTLIMMVAAFIGDDWRKVYQTALKNDYRFLSYGDCSLLWN